MFNRYDSRIVFIYKWKPQFVVIKSLSIPVHQFLILSEICIWLMFPPGAAHSPYSDPRLWSGRRKPPGAARRPRFNFSEDQVAELEDLYQKNNYVTLDDKACIANTLGVDEYKITVWFQNRRAKDKRVGIEPVLSADAKNCLAKSTADAKYSTPSKSTTTTTMTMLTPVKSQQQPTRPTLRHDIAADANSDSADSWDLSSNLSPEKFSINTPVFDADIMDTTTSGAAEQNAINATKSNDSGFVCNTHDNEPSIAASPSDLFAVNDYVWPVTVENVSYVGNDACDGEFASSPKVYTVL